MRASSRKLDERLKLKGEKKTKKYITYYYIKLIYHFKVFCISTVVTLKQENKQTQCSVYKQ